MSATGAIHLAGMGVVGEAIHFSLYNAAHHRRVHLGLGKSSSVVAHFLGDGSGSGIPPESDVSL